MPGNHSIVAAGLVVGALAVPGDTRAGIRDGECALSGGAAADDGTGRAVPWGYPVLAGEGGASGVGYCKSSVAGE